MNEDIKKMGPVRLFLTTFDHQKIIFIYFFIFQDDFETLTFPTARIENVMKLDEDVSHISAEAPILLSKAAEIFIKEITCQAWIQTKFNHRQLLMKDDIANGIVKDEQFDFLIDQVPRKAIREDVTYLKTATQQALEQVIFICTYTILVLLRKFVASN